MTTIAKTTTKGQITLPVAWRRKFSTNNFIVKSKGDVLEIRPIDLDSIKENNEYTVFDAIRDNKGKGIKAKKLVSTLKTIS